MNRAQAGCYSFPHRPDHFPGKATFLECPDNIAGKVKFPPAQSVSGAAGLGVMVIVVSLAEGQE